MALTVRRPVPVPGRFLAALILSVLTVYVASLNVGGLSWTPGSLSATGSPVGRLITVARTRGAATDTATLNSTGNSTLAGAQVLGKTVNVNVGGNLTVTSLQDQETQQYFGIVPAAPAIVGTGVGCAVTGGACVVLAGAAGTKILSSGPKVYGLLTAGAEAAAGPRRERGAGRRRRGHRRREGGRRGEGCGS
jgi:hypothetical protein